MLKPPKVFIPFPMHDQAPLFAASQIVGMFLSHGDFCFSIPLHKLLLMIVYVERFAFSGFYFCFSNLKASEEVMG